MTDDRARPRWTLAGLVEGVRLSTALLPGCVAMAMAIGTLSAQKGLSLIETVLMSGLLFAGEGSDVTDQIIQRFDALAGAPAAAPKGN